MAITGTYADGDEKTFEDAVIEIDESPASSSWAASESWIGDLQVSGGNVPTSDYKTVTNRIVTPGEQDAYEITIEGIYTEETDGLWYNLWTAFKAAPGVRKDVRWSDSGTAGDLRFSSSGGKLINVTPPLVSPNNPGVRTFQAVVRAGNITSAAIV